MQIIRMNQIVGICLQYFIAGVSEDRAERPVNLHPAAFRIDLGHADGRALEHPMPLALLFVAFGFDASPHSGGLLLREMRAHLPCERFEPLALRGGKIARARVQNTDRPEKLPVIGADRHAREETKMRSASHERARRKSRIRSQIGDFKFASLRDRERVKREIEI